MNTSELVQAILIVMLLGFLAEGTYLLVLLLRELFRTDHQEK